MVVEDHLGPSENPLEYQLEHLPERLLECLLECLPERLLEHYQDPKYFIRKMMDMNFFYHKPALVLPELPMGQGWPPPLLVEVEE